MVGACEKFSNATLIHVDICQLILYIVLNDLVLSFKITRLKSIISETVKAIKKCIMTFAEVNISYLPIMCMILSTGKLGISRTFSKMAKGREK